MKFCYSGLKGLEFDENITRRDPSPVIYVNGKYYIYYSRTPSIGGWDADVWAASSENGMEWKEECRVIEKGKCGAFDAGGVYTPTTLLANGYIYLFYTAVPNDFDVMSLNENGLTAIGLTKSKSPLGPFEKVGGMPILKTGAAPAFDSYRVDDTCLIKRNGKYHMYYKGRQLGHPSTETKMGLAISDYPEGPYVKSECSPVLKSGHEVCVFPTNGGLMALVTNVGSEGNTCQFSKDGIHFEVQETLEVPPSVGPLREDAYENNADFLLRWGVCHGTTNGRPYLRRFDVI